MLLTTRNYTRVEPHRDAKKIIIFAEGMKREVDYFNKLKDLDSRLSLIVYDLQHTEDNSPIGLLKSADECIKRKEINGKEFEFIEDLDELWFLIDTDTWFEKITKLREEVKREKGWFIAQSNPCFEVWLYYHFFNTNAEINELELCGEWKKLLNDKINGGFCADKHVFFIKYAIQNAKTNYVNKKATPNYGETEVYKLAQKITKILDEKLNSVLKKSKKNQPIDYFK